ncbi:hypothetical protein DRP05_04375 [Archaeoglobales archaeon]|nr:MAG: hypothetical protein DRP05_04375 [Archaeoglobales archaeon]
MRIKIIPNTPALILKNKVVIADLHLGLFNFFDKFVIEKALEIAELGDELIVLGDLKHLGKKGKVREFIESVKSVGVHLIVVKGNHDINFDVNVNLESSRGIRVGKYGLFHGHANPSDDVLQAKKLIFAHAHPSILLIDSVGGIKKRVWLEGKVEIGGDKKDLLVMPAFNDLCASTAVNIEKPAGVMFKKWDYKTAKAILLDGTLLNLDNLLSF